VPGKFTAFGNLILANDYGAVVNPDLPDETIKIVREQLDVPVHRGKIAGLKNVGAVAVATNRGILVHPDASSDEVKFLEDKLGVPAEVGTACGGVKFVGLCIIANSKGAIVGTTTTGPEMGRAESSLGFL
jgi:translation initiation factor 6